MKAELIWGALLILLMPYGWWSCVRIVRFSMSDPAFLAAGRWKQIVVRSYYWFGIVFGPVCYAAVLYVFYVKFLQ